LSDAKDAPYIFLLLLQLLYTISLTVRLKVTHQRALLRPGAPIPSGALCSPWWANNAMKGVRTPCDEKDLMNVGLLDSRKFQVGSYYEVSASERQVDEKTSILK